MTAMRRPLMSPTWRRRRPTQGSSAQDRGRLQREVLRSRHRVLAAMQAQAHEQGRYLGGRPPYGFRLVDAGPHPNRAHAGLGASVSAAGSRSGDRAACAVDVSEQRVAGRSVCRPGRMTTPAASCSWRPPECAAAQGMRAARSIKFPRNRVTSVQPMTCARSSGSLEPSQLLRAAAVTPTKDGANVEHSTTSSLTGRC
jgi:hypothetical protein